MRPLTAVVLLGIALLAWGCLHHVLGGAISGKEARRLVSEGAALVDVRTPEEYRRHHVEGAVNIPVAEIEKRAAEVGPKDRAVILYCASGVRSARARTVLRRSGFANVYNLGSHRNW